MYIAYICICIYMYEYTQIAQKTHKLLISQQIKMSVISPMYTPCVHTF